MANLFVDLPMPALNGPGASVATSGMGSPKTIVVDGVFSEANVIVEASVDGGIAFAAVTAFQGTGKRTLPLAATHMRVNVSGRKSSLPFACNVDVGANDAGAAFASITMPAGNGSGPAVDVSALANSYTIIAGGTFDGCTILLEVSDDGVGWAPAAQFAGQGGWLQKIVTANWMRATVRGRRGAVPFTGTLAVGASALTGGAGGGIELENASVPLAGGPFDTLDLDAALIAVDLGGGTAGVAITPIPDQTVLGNDSGVPASPTAVTADQIFDWVSSTDGVLLTRSGGAWGPAAKASIGADGDILLPRTLPTTAMTTPGANTVTVFAPDVAGRTMLGTLTNTGLRLPMQPLFGSRQIAFATPLSGAANPSLQGLAQSVVGTATARAPASTTYATMQRRWGVVSAAGAGSIASWRHALSGLVARGDAVGKGGFHFAACWNVSDAVLVADAQTFMALRASAGAPAVGEPSALTDVVGFGGDSTDMTLQVMHNDGAGACLKVDLGANFPLNSTNVDVYECHLYCPPNSGAIGYMVIRKNTGDVAVGSLVADLPTNTAMLTVSLSRSNGATAAAAAFDICGIYLESQ